jgi:hypothetical protein
VRIGDTCGFAIREWRGCNVAWVCSGEATPSPEGGGLGWGVRAPIDLRVCGCVFADPRTTMRVCWLRFVMSISASSATSAVQSGHSVPLRAVRIGDACGFAIREWRGCNVCWVCSGEATPSPEGGGLGRGVRTPIDLRVCGFVFAEPLTTMRVCWLRFVTLHLRLRLRVLRELRGSIRTQRPVMGCSDWRHPLASIPGIAQPCGFAGFVPAIVTMRTEVPAPGSRSWLCFVIRNDAD